MSAVLTVLWSALLGCGYSFSTTRPNFIFLLTDDQDLTLGSIDVMPNLHQLVIHEGITFNNAFVATPICCPSRTETMSGKYFHNVAQPEGGCMHASAINFTFANYSMFPLFQSNGYQTAMFGKLHNDVSFWCGTSPPIVHGFDRIFAFCNQPNFYDPMFCDSYYNNIFVHEYVHKHTSCTLHFFFITKKKKIIIIIKNERYLDKYPNGTYQLTNYTLSPSLYQTSMIGNATLAWLESLADVDAPFLAWIGPHAPHYGLFIYLFIFFSFCFV
ncbi:extracellular sulfatase Sulf-1 precursor [Reticulomyxa filosa]|uniref:Extracellular sulfatase Sulf-1 n=1 Tax=Reticulomyxa filosa TaxID=46433 RepID=X6N9Y5_RETFI|nr:extracellular sulfatase Sulf-1 precursor [Reticulomyxa filosa]|eukprot:ETO22564.1 extracellular sulfatase Sulf-1 precursor [Reticulomyxa filosa]